MRERLNYYKAAPDGVKALRQVGTYLKTSGLEAGLLHLVYLRASQINGCAFCVDMHTREALRDGEQEKRLHMLVVWRESPLFSERERAALGWTEAVTRLEQTHAPDDVYEEARRHFDEAGIANLTLAVAVINAWNRMAVGFRTPPAG
jgi:AhpD family alkylhydroperoxidase